MWKVIVNIDPKTISGTNGCHKYVYETTKTKKQALATALRINELGTLGTATVEKI